MRDTSTFFRDRVEYIADMAEATALEAERIGGLLEARQGLEIARQRHSDVIARLRNELFQFARVLNELLDSAPEGRNWQTCAYESQRFQNWDRLHPKAQRIFPTFQDKEFLEQVRKSANRLMVEAGQRLGANLAAVRRRAVLDDLAPLADQYGSWKKVLLWVRRCTPLLFNGIPGVLIFITFVVVFPIPCAMLLQYLTGASRQLPGLIALPIDLMLLVLALLFWPIIFLGIIGPFLRKVIAVFLNKTVSASGGWLTSRITASEVRSILLKIAHQIAALEPSIPINGSIIADHELDKIQNEVLSVRGQQPLR